MLIITEENDLDIPIGAILEFGSMNLCRTSNGTSWDTVSFYTYHTKTGHTILIHESDIMLESRRISFYKNLILLDNFQTAIEGSPYWKVYIEFVGNPPKLERNPLNSQRDKDAILLKPYLDIVHDNTNRNAPPGQRRFKTEEQALAFIAYYKTHYR